MKKILYVFFLFSIVYCSLNKNEYPCNQINDCIIYDGSKYCLTFVIDKHYTRLKELYMSIDHYEANQIYNFISTGDSIDIIVYIHKHADYNIQNNLTDSAYIASMARKLNYDYQCNVTSIEFLDNFLKGNLLSCEGNNLSVVSYLGSHYKNFAGMEVSILIRSLGTGDQMRRKKHIEHLVSSMRIERKAIE